MRIYRQTHLWAACLFTCLFVIAFWMGRQNQSDWRLFCWLTGPVALFAWAKYIFAGLRNAQNPPDRDLSDPIHNFPEGQAKLIDGGRLPNRFHPGLDLREYEICHFYVPGIRLFFTPFLEGEALDPTRMVIRYSGGRYYYIVKPQEILLPAQLDEAVAGELVITSQRILFLAVENGFEVPLQSLKLLDCSAHIIDFQVKDRRYTVQTDAAGYAEKVLKLLLQTRLRINT
ncbi:MAG: hypothetical protein KBG64_03045 [Clostridia bacterium]|nr:hypothetical protein [Clostridia bacterium]